MTSEFANIRLRIAAHAGPVHFDGNGLTGMSVIHLFRLLEAPAFKHALTATSADLGLE